MAISITGQRPVQVRADVFFEDLANPGREIPLGAIDDVIIEHGVSKQSLPFRRGPGGGNEFSRDQVDNIMLKLKVYNQSSTHPGLKIAMAGSSAATAAGSVVSESLTLVPSARTSLEHLGPTLLVLTAVGSAWAATTPYAQGDQVVASGGVFVATVAGTSGGTIPTWPTTLGGTVVDGGVTWRYVALATLLANTDYQQTSAGIWVLPTARIYSTGAAFTAAYSYSAYATLAALKTLNTEWRVRVDGVNEADGNRAFELVMHRVQFSPSANVPLINADPFAALELAGEVLADSSQPLGDGFSPYYVQRFAEAIP